MRTHYLYSGGSQGVGMCAVETTHPTCLGPPPPVLPPGPPLSASKRLRLIQFTWLCHFSWLLRNAPPAGALALGPPTHRPSPEGGGPIRLPPHPDWLQGALEEGTGGGPGLAFL